MSTDLIPQQRTLSDKAYNLIAKGDLSALSQDELTTYYFLRCKAVGLDPNTQPFNLMSQQGKTILYANSSCAQQLCERHGLTTQILSREATDSDTLYEVLVRVTDPQGRSTENIGIVPIANLRGDALANARMKAVTKAKRRTIFDHCGLGMLDETEVQDMTILTPVGTVNAQTGEVVQETRQEETAEQRQPTKQETILKQIADRQAEIGYEGQVKPLICAVLGEDIDPAKFKLSTYEKALARPVQEWRLAAEMLKQDAELKEVGKQTPPQAQSETDDEEDGFTN